MKFSTVTPQNLSKLTRELNAGLSGRLSLDDQFNGFIAEITINAGEELQITNRLRDAGGRTIIPGEWAVIDAAGAPAGDLHRGDEPWTSTHLYLKNSGKNNGIFKVRFMARPKIQGVSSQLAAPEQPADQVEKFAVLSQTGSQTIPTNTTSWTTAEFDTEDQDPASVVSVAADVFTFTESGWADIDFFIQDVEATAYLGINVRLFDITDNAALFTFNQFQLDANNATGACWPRKRIEIDSTHTYKWQWKTDAAGTTATARGAIRCAFYFL